MEHFKKYWWLYLIILVGIIYAVKYFTSTQGGSAPSQEDELCRTGGLSGGGSRLTQQCTRPNYNVVGGVKQKCWTSEELGGIEFGPETITDNVGLIGTKWYYNFQSGNKFCYVNNTKYKF